MEVQVAAAAVTMGHQLIVPAVQVQTARVLGEVRPHLALHLLMAQAAAAAAVRLEVMDLQRLAATAG